MLPRSRPTRSLPWRDTVSVLMNVVYVESLIGTLRAVDLPALALPATRQLAIPRSNPLLSWCSL